MLRVLALIKYENDLVGLRLLDERSKAFGDYNMESAVKYINAYGCSNIKIVGTKGIESLECSIERICVIDTKLNYVSGGKYFILGKLIDGDTVAYRMIDYNGNFCDITENELLNKINATELVNAKVVTRGTTKVVSAIKGTIKELEVSSKGPKVTQRDNRILDNKRNGWKTIYKFADGSEAMAKELHGDIRLVSSSGEEVGKSININWLEHNKVADPTYKDILIYQLKTKLDKNILNNLIIRVKTRKNLVDALVKYTEFEADSKDITLRLLASGKYVDVVRVYEYKGTKYAVVTKNGKYLGLVDCTTFEEIIPCYFERKDKTLTASVSGLIELALPLLKDASDVWGGLSTDSHILGRYNMYYKKASNLKMIELSDIEDEEDIEYLYDIEDKVYSSPEDWV